MEKIAWTEWARGGVSAKKAWWSASSLYLDEYAEAITDEYQPFVKGLAGLDDISLNQTLCGTRAFSKNAACRYGQRRSSG